MKKSTFDIPKMDCPSEESMIRMKLDEFPGIKKLGFDIPGRRLDVFHSGDVREIIKPLQSLGLGAILIQTIDTDEETIISQKDQVQRKVLWAVLAINLFLFVAEMVAGIISGSMGLVADSLDMLADSFVYGLSLYVVGGAILRKKKIARVSGYLQIALAILGFSEVVRRFIGYDSPPDFMVMIVVSTVALAANSFCLYLLQKAKSDEAHMKASWIFTSNDILANLGVIVAALLVMATGSNRPDLIIGAIMFAVVLRGAFRILQLAN
jgi:Co/Zn/Cd efflux system component